MTQEQIDGWDRIIAYCRKQEKGASMSEIDDTIKWLDKQFAAIRCDGGGWIAFCADAGNAYPALRDHIGELTKLVSERDAEIARLRKIEAAVPKRITSWGQAWLEGDKAPADSPVDGRNACVGAMEKAMKKHDVLSWLKYVWRRQPDLRLGQLIYILIHTEDGVSPSRLFSIEDGELMRLLQQRAMKSDTEA